MPLPLLLISSPMDFAGEHEMLEAMFEQGLLRFALRKPGIHESELERWLLALDADFRSRVVVHGYPGLAQGMDLAGCHMPLDWLRAGNHQLSEFAGVREWSVSLHGFEELRQCPAGVSRCYLGPVFDSISKQGYLSAFTGDEIRAGLFMARARTAHCPQVYALGGVEADKFSRIAEYGFDGAAVLGAVWNAPDPVGACAELLQEAEATHV